MSTTLSSLTCPYRSRLMAYGKRTRTPLHRADAPVHAPLDEACCPSEQDPLRLQPESVAVLRERLHLQRKRMDDPALERFVHNAFSDDLMVEAYFQPRALWSPALPLHQRGMAQLPWDAALRAAHRASGMAIVTQPHERQLAYAASLLYACGLFHGLHPWVVKDAGTSNVDNGRADGVRAYLLEDSLRRLRRDHSAMGNTLGEVFSQGLNDDLDPEQVGRIGTAVWISHRRIAELWTA